MATAQELQQKLQAKLRELFQLDQPDLDFGFYRVMHAKQREISQFLDEKLPQIISEQFKDSNGAKLQQEFEAARHAVITALGATAIKSDGSLDALYAATPMGQQYESAKTALKDGTANAGGEVAVYDHLYHFFERYYDKGDFVSLRYLTRETDHKAKPYAIPYAGEEVMLHWANADQYYVKTSENFSHFTFDAAKHPEVEKMDAGARMINNVPASLKVHFEIVGADEGDHGNIKAGKDRFFLLHAEKPCEVKDGEITVYFEYREDPEMAGQSAKWQEKRRSEAVETLKTALPAAGLSAELVTFLFCNLETDPKAKAPRILLDVYLKRYFARNTSDYFIHKDLGGFLRRELDFYIKNDLMVLDDVAAATPESVAKWLGTLKVFRAIAEDIITFLAQLEDFQKRLWLKKKFVVQCDYCITMDRVPEELRAEVLANEKQLAAWKALGTDVDPKAIDMTAIDARMVDTQYFDESFKQKLLASIDNFDEQCDGVLIHSESFGALNSTTAKYGNQVRCIYIDPPYNTGGDGFKYKDTYRHSSWMSMIRDRLDASKRFLGDNSVLFTSIDENEIWRYSQICQSLFRYSLGTIAVKNNPKGRIFDRYYSTAHEYLLSFADTDVSGLLVHIKSDEEIERDYPLKDKLGRYRLLELRNTHREFGRFNRPNLYYPLYANSDGSVSLSKQPSSIEVYPKWEDGFEGCWTWGAELAASSIDKLQWKTVGTSVKIYRKAYALDGEEVTKQVKTIWDDKRYQTDKGQIVLTDLFGGRVFSSPKPIGYLQDILRLVNHDRNCLVLDYFAGSGTTAHAVIDLNRQDKGRRKYILIEMGDHFDTVLKPRVQKVVYSSDWKDGKPVFPNQKTSGVSHCFKYLRLESYEDALNNLVVDEAKGAAFAGLSDYFLKYMLDVETKGSASLMNVEEFVNPFGYKLVVKKPGSEERETRVVDLVETFNYLIGLRVKQTSAVKAYTALFERPKDEELPEDGHTKLVVKGRLRLAVEGEDADAEQWKFRTVEGWIPKNRATPNDGAKERVFIVWRTLSGDLEKDNAVLDEFLKREQVNALNGEYDVIYVNGSNNVPNLKKESDVWKVRLIEEDFRARMWEGN